jgi:phage gpG-like protein
MAKSNKFEMKAEIKFPSKAEIKASGTDPAKAVKAFQTGVLRGSNQVEADLPVALNQALEASVWGPFSPKTPYVSKGGQQRAGGMRNIVDTGALKDSLKIKTKFLQTKVSTVISYGAPYAAFVHYGGVIQPYGNQNANSVIIPARPWVEAVLTGNGPVKPYEYRKVYQDAIDQAWNE